MPKYVSYDEMMEILDNKYLLPFRKDERLRGLNGIDIVRCKDCKHWQPHSQHGYDYDDDAFYDYCGLLVPDDDYYAVRRDASDFCSYGERSEE